MSDENCELIYYLAEQQTIEQFPNFSLQVTRTKNEALFSCLRDLDLHEVEFVKIMADDDILRTFAFLFFSNQFSLSMKYPIIAEYPLFIENQSVLIKSLNMDGMPLKKRKDELEEELKDVQEEVNKAYQLMTLNVFSLLIKDPSFMRMLRSGRVKSKELDKIFDRIVERRQDEVLRIIKEYIIPLAEKHQSLLELSVFNQALKKNFISRTSEECFYSVHNPLGLPRAAKYPFRMH